MTDAQALIDMVRGLLAAGGIVFLRVGAAAFMLPVFGERVVPMRVRTAGALALTVLIAPLAVDKMPADPPVWAWFLLTETIAGLAFGAVLRLIAMALQIAGSMAAQATSLAQIFGGQAADPMPAIGHVMFLAGLSLLAASGLHVKLVAYFALSYDLLPAGQLPAPADFLEWGVQRTAQTFSLAFALAAPFVVASVLYNLALGVINRAMPQLMVAFVGAPAITAGSLALLAVSLPAILTVWFETMNAILANPAGLP